MNLVTRGLVLRSTDYREGDKLLTVLTDTMPILFSAVIALFRRCFG